MTRPMPGPPEKYQVLRRYVLVWRGGVEHYQHSSEIDAKRLTDAECAAEFWRAMNETNSASLNNCPECPGCQAIVDEELTWHRFAIYPHALESDGAAS